MKSPPVIYRSLALILSSMIFLSSTGLSIDMHFCGNHLQSFSLLGEAKSCVEKANSCQKHVVQAEEKRCPIGCCSDETVEMESEDLMFFQQLQLSSDSPMAFASSLVAMVFNNKSCDEYTRSPLVYKPPKIIKHIFALVESFRL